MVSTRITTFMSMLTVQPIIGLEFTEDFEPVRQKYEYLNGWLRENLNNKNLASDFEKEYKKYLKEHK